MRTLPQLSSLLLLASGCVGSSYVSSPDVGMGTSEMGVTQGGAQDVDLAREIIEGGGIPDQSQFTTEGLFSSHDLPLDGERCRKILCPRGASALINPVDRSGQRLLVQLGFGSRINPSTFQRRPLNLSIALDISGSMGGSKIETVRQGMREMVDQLTEEDTVSLVLFNHESRTVMQPTVMNEGGRQRFTRVIAEIYANGSTNIEAGLADSFEHVSQGIEATETEHRVMLLTDAKPNVGGTSLNTFSGLARHYAEAGIGLSVFGVGLDLGAELATEVSNLPGGNSMFLADDEDIIRVFNEEFDYVVSPIAYNLDVAVDTGRNMMLDATWAAPTDPESDAIEFGTSSLFLSTKSGGMGITLDFPGDSPSGNVAAEMAMSFETLGGKVKSEDLEIAFEGGQTYTDAVVQADDLGVYKMAYLIDVIIALESAAEACDGDIDIETAQVHANRAADRLRRVSKKLDDSELSAEADMLDSLSTNLSAQPLRCSEAELY